MATVSASSNSSKTRSSEQNERCANAERDLEYSRKHVTAANERFAKLEAVDKLTRATLILAISALENDCTLSAASRDALLEAAYLATRMPRP